MYTVLRFLGTTEQRDELTAIGHALNERWEGVFERLAKRGDSFVCSISSDDDWREHSAAIRDALADFEDLIQRATAMKIRVVFDTAVWPIEYKPATGTRIVQIALPPDLMAIAGAAGVWFMTSTYVLSDLEPEPA